MKKADEKVSDRDLTISNLKEQIENANNSIANLERVGLKEIAIFLSIFYPFLVLVRHKGCPSTLFEAVEVLCSFTVL